MRLSFTLNTAIARMNALQDSCITPATLAERSVQPLAVSHCSATVAVALSPSLSSQRFHKAAFTRKWLGRKRVAPTSRTQISTTNLSTSHKLLIYLSTAVIRVKALIQLCVIPVVPPQGSVPTAGLGRATAQAPQFLSPSHEC